MTTTTVDYEQLLLRLVGAKLHLFDDIEVHLRRIGKNSLDAGEAIPEWIFSDLEYVMKAQGAFRRVRLIGLPKAMR